VRGMYAGNLMCLPSGYGIRGPDPLSVCGATKRNETKHGAALLSTAPKIIPCAALRPAHFGCVVSTYVGSVRARTAYLMVWSGVAGGDLCAV